MWAGRRALATRLHENGMGQPMQNSFGRPGSTEYRAIALGVRCVAANDWRCGLGWRYCKRLDAAARQTRLDCIFGVAILRPALIDERGNCVVA